MYITYRPLITRRNIRTSVKHVEKSLSVAMRSRTIRSPTRILRRNDINANHVRRFLPRDINYGGIKMSIGRSRLHLIVSIMTNQTQLWLTTIILGEKVKKSRKTNHMIKTDDNDATPDQSSDGNSDLNAVETIPNKCYVCDITLQNMEDFNVHLEGHRVMLPYKCKQCSTDKNPIKMYSMPALNKHFERHGYSHICPQCPLSYRSKRTLQYHIRNAHKEGNVEYTCATCAKVYTNGNDYRNHVNGHRNVMMQRYNCEHCQLSFSRKGHLHRHQKTAGCMSRYQQDHMTSVATFVIIVGKRAKESELETVAVETGNASVETTEQKVPLNSREEDRNILEPHEDNQLENATKREPSKRKKKSQINRMNKHPERTIPKGVKTASNKCYICDTILESKNDFEEHLKSHENLLPFKGSQFVSHENPALISTVIDLNEHFEKHVFSFICPHCPLRFRLSSKLARHIQSVHEKKKVGHTCETCGKVLENPISFRTHVRAHRNLLAERFKCEPCQKIFSLKHLYLNHKASYVCLRKYCDTSLAFRKLYYFECLQFACI